MPQIRRVAHVIFAVSDVDNAVDFYSKKLGSQVMVNNYERGMTFLPFGTQHRDIGLFRARGEGPRARSAWPISRWLPRAASTS